MITQLNHRLLTTINNKVYSNFKFHSSKKINLETPYQQVIKAHIRTWQLLKTQYLKRIAKVTKRKRVRMRKEAFSLEKIVVVVKERKANKMPMRVLRDLIVEV